MRGKDRPGPRVTVPGRERPASVSRLRPSAPASGAAPARGRGRQDGLTGTHWIPRAATVPAEGATSGKKALAPGALQCDSPIDRGSNLWERLKAVVEGETQTAGFPVKDYQVCLLGFLTEPLSENTF